MKLVTFSAFTLMTAGMVAAFSPADPDALFAREMFDSDESLYARDEDAETLFHVLRTVEHVRRLAEDHAEFAARALDEFADLQSRGRKSSRPVKPLETVPENKELKVKPKPKYRNNVDCIKAECLQLTGDAKDTCITNCIRTY